MGETCVLVVPRYEDLLQVCRVQSGRQSVCRDRRAGAGERQLIGHQQGPLLQLGRHLALILVLEIKQTFWVSGRYKLISQTATLPVENKLEDFLSILREVQYVDLYNLRLSWAPLCKSGPCSMGEKNLSYYVTECTCYINTYVFNVPLVLSVKCCKEGYCKYC